MGAFETLLKECGEEAGMSEQLARNSISTGTVITNVSSTKKEKGSFWMGCVHLCVRGVHVCRCEYVYIIMCAWHCVCMCESVCESVCVRHLCVCVLCVCVFVCVCLCVCVCVCLCVCVCVNMCVWDTFVHVRVCVCVFLYWFVFFFCY